MFEKSIYGKFHIAFLYENESLDNLDDAGYVIVQTPPDSSERIRRLSEMGYRFHDRFLTCSIALNHLDGHLVQMVRADVRREERFDEMVYRLAVRAFLADRRFHLDTVSDRAEQLPENLIQAYLTEFENMGCYLYKIFHKDKLIGFTVIRDTGEGICENVLGAVDPDYQNRGAAFNLYTYMADALRKGGYETLTGRISSRNMASLNLHLMLGGRFRNAVDWYVVG